MLHALMELHSYSDDDSDRHTYTALRKNKGEGEQKIVSEEEDTFMDLARHISTDRPEQLEPDCRDGAKHNPPAGPGAADTRASSGPTG